MSCLGGVGWVKDTTIACSFLFTYFRASNIFQVYQYFTICKLCFFLKFENFVWISMQHSLKLEGTNYHFKWVEVPCTAPYCKVWYFFYFFNIELEIIFGKSMYNVFWVTVICVCCSQCYLHFYRLLVDHEIWKQFLLILNFPWLVVICKMCQDNDTQGFHYFFRLEVLSRM